jgi:hypothetical protein
MRQLTMLRLITSTWGVTRQIQRHDLQQMRGNSHQTPPQAETSDLLRTSPRLHAQPREQFYAYFKILSYLSKAPW